MGKLEILAPAGSPEHLIPALRCGADAVYLGLKEMSARAHAVNFTPEELETAVFDCHVRGVKVYLTLNTLVKERETRAAMEAVRLACEAGVDAVIVQDLGLAARIKKAAPDIPLHASTQMSVHTPEGARLLQETGFRRIVLARECSREEIAAIREAVTVELEVFVHGALCMSVSGQCYLSAMLGGRSGNRGQCAQPCRLPFSGGEGSEFALSLKDLSLIELLPEIQKMGIVSAKIEGRMKRPEYVAAAVRACRSVVDTGKLEETDRRRLSSVFSRSGFTKGYYEGTLGGEMFGVRVKEDVTAATGPLLAELRQTYKNEPGRIPVNFSLRAEVGKPAALRAWTDGTEPVEVEGCAAEEAVQRPLEEERCRAQLCKTGGTPFLSSPERTEILLTGQPSLPLSELNRMRREALERLMEKRRGAAIALSLPDTDGEPPPPSARKNRRGDSAGLRAHFMRGELPEEAKKCELCYLPLFTEGEVLRNYIEQGYSVGVELPRGLFSLEERARTALRAAYSAGVRDAYTGNLGGIPLIREAGMRLHGGFGLNLFNGEALRQAADWGATDCEVSLELSREEIADMPKPLPAGMVAYGRLPLMLTRNCPFRAAGGSCKQCEKKGALTDRKGMVFPVRCNGACTEILNALPLEMSDRLTEIQGLQFISLRFTVESFVETEEKLHRYFVGKRPQAGYTRGLWERSVL